jgi:hypothetical protein
MYSPSEDSPTSEEVPLDNKPSQLCDMVSNLILLCNTMSGPFIGPDSLLLEDYMVERRVVKENEEMNEKRKNQAIYILAPGMVDADDGMSEGESTVIW